MRQISIFIAITLTFIRAAACSANDAPTGAAGAPIIESPNPRMLENKRLNDSPKLRIAQIDQLLSEGHPGVSLLKCGEFITFLARNQSISQTDREEFFQLAETRVQLAIDREKPIDDVVAVVLAGHMFALARQTTLAVKIAKLLIASNPTLNENEKSLIRMLKDDLKSETAISQALEPLVAK